MGVFHFQQLQKMSILLRRAESEDLFLPAAAAQMYACQEQRGTIEMFHLLCELDLCLLPLACRDAVAPRRLSGAQLIVSLKGGANELLIKRRGGLTDP